MPQPKTIVITGASAGIGAELARQLGREGNQLVLAARRLDELQTVASESEALGSPRALAIQADVTRRSDNDHVADATIREFGGFDVWINNVGRGITRSVLDLTGDDIDVMMDVNVKSALYGMQAASAHFLERGHGHIINISSFLGRVPLALHRSAYNAAKAALNALTANLRVELRQRNPNIHVTLVMPGMVATEFAKNALGAPPDAKAYAGGHVQAVADVAAVVSNVIAEPVAEVYTNPASRQMAERYFADVAAFEDGDANQWATPPSR